MEKKFLVMLSQTFRLGYSCKVYNRNKVWWKQSCAELFSKTEKTKEASMNGYCLLKKVFSHNFSKKRIDLYIINT